MTEFDERFLVRGKRTDSGEWVEGFYCWTSMFTSSIAHVPQIIEKNGFVFYEIIPETLGRYTGLKDKNGTKIFEWDILKAPNWGCYGKVVYEVPECHYIIEMSDGNWVPMHDFAGDVEVIGNIHDNKELLEK